MDKPLSPTEPPTDVLSRRDILKLASMGVALSSVHAAGLAQALNAAEPLTIPRGASNTHDLALPDWGPYSKKYFGISHIPDVTRGLSFNLSLFPQLTNTVGPLPSVLATSGVYPWEASTNVDFYTLRMETLWKDQLFCDISFCRNDESSRLIRIELVNRTDEPQQLTLNSLAELSYPGLHASTAEPIRLTSVSLPTGAMWTHALDYIDLKFAKPRPTDNLVTDALWRAEVRQHDAVDGSVIAQHFGRDPGDTVSYRVALPQAYTDAVMLWRFLGTPTDAVTFHLNGSANGKVVFQGHGDFSTVSVPLGKLSAGTLDFHLTSAGGGNVALNGFALVESGHAGQVVFTPQPWQRDPHLDTTSVPGASILRYDDTGNVYGFALGEPLSSDRKLTWTALDDVFGKSDLLTSNRRKDDPDSLFVHASSKPFTIAPNASRIVYGIVCTGTPAQVQSALRAFNPHSPAHEATYTAARASACQPTASPAGEPFLFSQKQLAVVTLTNLVYPVYAQRQYIRHYTPGRRWDSLYTWDDGFIGLGLLELDTQRAVDILNAYTTPPGSQSAFIHHGTPLPVQIYLFTELWNRTQSRELLAYFYPRLRQFYEFVAGRLGSSTTRQHKDQLICTWDYFYNTGGWDDYAPQVYVHANKLTAATAPVISTAHVIRCAKLLRMAAAALGRTQDFAAYDADISLLSNSLQKFSWDADSGYFGYVLHDNDGNPTGILRDTKGQNFNMGLDGVAPLNAGICTPAQQQSLLDRIFSSDHLWTDIGITTVDRSASYYKPDGYWNGNVWMAHQWWLWKTMLDLDRADLAMRIAQTGLNTWKKTTDATYASMEHFSVKTGMGEGWPQFSSLSSPVLSWFASLYTPGRLTCGFEVWIETQTFTANNRSLRARLRTTAAQPGQHFSVLACMDPSQQYKVTWNGRPVPTQRLHDGLLQIQLPYETRAGELFVDRTTS